MLKHNTHKLKHVSRQVHAHYKLKHPYDVTRPYDITVTIIIPLLICWPFMASCSNSRDKEDERVSVICW